MVAKRSFDSILEQVQASNLNFQLQVSPFSATISLKKTLIRDKFGNLLLPPSPILPNHEVFEHQNNLLELESENVSLKKEMQELQISKKSSQETIQILEQKIAKVEASALKLFEERNTEVAVLKKSLKSMNIEIENSKKDSLAKNKFIKEREKEVYKFQQKCQNLEDSLKKSKTDNSSLKSENSKLTKRKIVKVKASQNVSTNTSPVKELITLPPSTDHFSNTSPLINPSPITSKIPFSVASSLSPTLSTDMLNNERPSSLSSFSSKLSSVTPVPESRIPQVTNILSSSKIQTTKFSTASCLDHSCSLETIASLDPTNNSSLHPTSSSLTNTTTKNPNNISTSNEETEDYAEVYNALMELSTKVDALSTKFQDFAE